MKPTQHFSPFFPDATGMLNKIPVLKKISLYLLTFILFLSCDSDNIQDTEIPSMALNGFYMKFPQADKVQWEEEAPNYQARFEISGEDHKLLLDPKGNILKFKKEIGFSELPQAVKNRISESYSSANEDEAGLLKIGNIRYYEVELERFVINDHIIFDESGEVISGISF